MKVRSLIIILSILASMINASSCDTVDCQASCVAPPDGEIVANRINVVTWILIVNNDGDAVQIDGPVEILAGGNWIEMTNYTWLAVESGESITALRFSLDDIIYTIPEENFTFFNTEKFETGSFLINIKLDSSDTTISDDLLFLQITPFDGSCDPGC